MPKVVDHEERRALIIDTAIRLFVERGYASVGMRELAGELGMTKSALYHYFPSKRELFAGVVTRVETRELREAGEALALVDGHPLPERIAAFLAYLEEGEAGFTEELLILLEARRLGEAPAGGGASFSEALAGLLGLEPGAGRALYLAATGLLLDRALGGSAGGASLAEPLSWLVNAVCGSAPAAEAAREAVHG